MQENQAKETVGLIGLGAMGLPMGKRLLASGYPVVAVPHRHRGPAEELASLGASVAGSPSDLRGTCAVVITALPDVPQVSEVLFGEEGLLSGSHSGGLTLVVDMSTINPQAARDHHARLAAQGVDALDAPVSGGPMRAADGSLTIMVGGSEGAVERAMPLLSVLGQNIVHVGGPGTGQVVKLANQLMISTIMLANAEALLLGVKGGVPLETLTEVIGTSSGSNYLMQNWLPRTLFSGDISGGFALDLLIKDLRAALEAAQELGVPAFGGALAQQLYSMARNAYGGRVDYSAVVQLYEEAAEAALRTADTTPRT
jgi:3-hydroxyisobutyrate dehydrogenase-like beta-hydroxyacid dehydrogenase